MCLKTSIEENRAALELRFIELENKGIKICERMSVVENIMHGNTQKLDNLIIGMNILKNSFEMEKASQKVRMEERKEEIYELGQRVSTLEEQVNHLALIVSNGN